MPRTLVVLLLLSPALSAQGPPQPRLVEGRFGKALDAAATPLAFTGDAPLPHPAFDRRVLGQARQQARLQRARLQRPQVVVAALGDLHPRPHRPVQPPTCPATSRPTSSRRKTFATANGTTSP